MTTSLSMAARFEQQLSEQPDAFPTPWRIRGPLNQLRKLYDRDLTPEEVTADVLKAFRALLRRNGYAPKTAREYVCTIRKLAGHAVAARRADGIDRSQAAGPLADYVRDVHAKARKLQPASVKAYLQSIAILNTHVGRPLSIDELTAEVIDEHAAWMAERYSPKTCEGHLIKLRSLLKAKRQAAERLERDRERQRRVESGATGTLLKEYFEDTYLPEKASSAARKSREKFRWAVNLFLRSSRLDVTIESIKPRTMSQFHDFLTGRDFSARRIQQVEWMLNCVLNAADPVRFKRCKNDRPGTRPTSAEQEGELWRFYVDVYETRRLVDGSDSTLNQYRRALCRLSRAAGHPATFADLTDENIAQVMNDITAAGGSIETANGVRSKLVAFWKFCNHHRKVDTWPEVRRGKTYRRVPRAWSAAEVDQIFTAAMQEPGMIACIPAKLWWQALLMTLYDTGARIGATLELTWDRVQLQHRTLHLLAEHQKHHADQAYRLHPDTVAALQAIREPRRRMVFTWPHTEVTLYNRYGRILKRAGLPSGGKDKFHKLRRTHATMLTDAVGLDDASMAMGHSSVKLTRDHYVDFTMVNRPAPCDVLPRPKTPVLAKGGAT